MPKTISFGALELEAIYIFCVSETTPQYTNIDRDFEILNQVQLNHHNKKETESVQQLCLELSDIFLEGDHLRFRYKFS